MRKSTFIIIALSLMIVGAVFLTGCSKQTEKTREYNIDKIIIPKQKDFPPEILAYEQMSIGIIKAMAEEQKIPVEVKEFANYKDVNVAIRQGHIDVLPGISKIGLDDITTLTNTYTYFSGEITTGYSNTNANEVFETKENYFFVVRKDDKELYKFLNDMIEEYKKNGKLKEVQTKFLGPNREY